MTPEALSAYTALVMAVAALLVGIWRASWGAHNELVERDKKIMDMRIEIDEKLSELHDDINNSMDRNNRVLGESMAALRQKGVHTDQKHMQAELWNRDNFVRRVEFSDAIAGLREDIKSNSLRFDRKLDLIDAKLDKMKE